MKMGVTPRNERIVIRGEHFNDLRFYDVVDTPTALKALKPLTGHHSPASKRSPDL
jgi:hypothetical protein